MESLVTLVKEGPKVPYQIMRGTFYKTSQIYKIDEEYFLSLLEKPEEKYLDKKWMIPLGKVPEVPKEILDKYFSQNQEESSQGHFLAGVAMGIKKAAEFEIGDNDEGKKVEYRYLGLVDDYFESMRGLENGLVLDTYKLLKRPSILGTSSGVPLDSPVHIVVTETYHTKTIFEIVFMRWLTINLGEDETANPVFVRVLYEGEGLPIDAKIMIDAMELKTMTHFQESLGEGDKVKSLLEKVRMFLGDE